MRYYCKELSKKVGCIIDAKIHQDLNGFWVTLFDDQIKITGFNFDPNEIDHQELIDMIKVERISIKNGENIAFYNIFYIDGDILEENILEQLGIDVDNINLKTKISY